MAHTTDRSDLVLAQTAVKICERHNRNTDQYCKDCKVLVCLVCARLSHVRHKWEPVRKLADDKRKIFRTTLEDVHGNYFPLLRRRIKTIDKTKKENSKKCEEQIAILLRHHDDIFRKLAEIKERHKQMLTESLSRKNADLDVMKTELEEQEENLKEMCAVLEEGNMTDHRFLEHYFSLEDNLKKISRPNTNIASCFFSVFVQPENIDASVMESIAGNIFNTDDISLTEIASFIFGADGINSLAATAETASWLYEQKGTQIVQVGFQGEVLNTVDIKCECDAFTIGPNNEIIVTHLEAHNISIMSSSGVLEHQISTSPLEPEGVSLANNGAIFVTLVDNSMEFILNSGSRRLVRLMTLSGDVMRDYEFREDRKTRLFTLPRRVIQRRNSDICVVDFLNERQGILHVLTIEGQKLGVYTGQSLDHDFLPTDVVADNQCNIIITDPANNVLHLLNSEGEFLKLLTPLKGNYSIPISLSLFGEIIWVGNFNGRVNIYRYKNDII
ncbi:uncharacterized protein LOC134273272 [Saccostrea cucullata]|uniref:uncharacterized protein LOC134273272 n=1 Tax=Saccostrea cuccullata TaxID=36930 RepID=UPI002ED14CCC